MVIDLRPRTTSFPLDDDHTYWLTWDHYRVLRWITAGDITLHGEYRDNALVLIDDVSHKIVAFVI